LNKTKHLAEDKDKLLLSPAAGTSTGSQDASFQAGNKAVEDTAPKPARTYALNLLLPGLFLTINCRWCTSRRRSNCRKC
jgi:hypothetical protein